MTTGTSADVLSHDIGETMRILGREGTAAFLVPATPVDEVVRIASAGLLLPQKSTYFLPKLSSGWVLHVHERPGEAWRGAVWGGSDREVESDWLEPDTAGDPSIST